MKEVFFSLLLICDLPLVMVRNMFFLDYFLANSLLVKNRLVNINYLKFRSGRRGNLTVSTQYSGSKGPGSSPKMNQIYFSPMF